MMVAKSPRFTAEEERELIAVMRAGDAAFERMTAEDHGGDAGLQAAFAAGQEAKDLLARSVIPWACKVALQADDQVDPEEAEAIAFYSVHRCLLRIDPDKGRLTTIVARSVWRMVRYNHRRYAGPIASPEWVFNPPSGREASDEQYEQACRARYRPANIDRLGNSIFGRMVDETAPDPAELLQEQEDRQQLSGRMRRALATLSAREQEVVRRRILQGHLLREVGRDLKISRERVRQIEQAALAKLKQVLEVIDGSEA